MKRLLFLSLLTMLFTSCFIKHQLVKSSPIDPIMPKKDSVHVAFHRPNDTAKMKFTIKARNGNEVKSNNIFIDLEFKNISNQSIKILDMFNDLGLNFYLHIVPQGGEEMWPFGIVTKTDFPFSYEFKYILIPGNQSYVKTINLIERLKEKNIILSPGLYYFEMDYGPYYVKDFICGSFKCDRITLNVTNQKFRSATINKKGCKLLLISK